MALGVIWVLDRHVPRDGTLTIDIPLDGRSPWFEAFLPGQRATAPKTQEGGWIGQRVTDEPVYARLRLPGAYETAQVSIEFRPNDQPLVEIGVERGAEPNTSFELVPLWSRELEAASFVSTTIDGVRWLADPLLGRDVARADVARVAWHASGTKSAEWADQGEPNIQVIRASLRGQHDFWFIPRNGEIDLGMTLQDMNRSRSTSNAAIRLMRDGELLWTDSVNFGGKDDASPSALVQKQWNFKKLPPGAYQLSILADDSIFIRGWQTTARHWVVGPRIYFADEVGYSTSTPPVQVWTNLSYADVKTVHKEGLQTVFLGSASTTIQKTHGTYPITRLPGEQKNAVPFIAPKGNVWLLGDGYVSWSKEALFFPQVRRLTDKTRFREEGVRAVATGYRSPTPLGDGWYQATAEFRLNQERDRLKLVLAAPGIAQRGTSIDVRRIRVTYRRPPRETSWWPAIRTELVRAWHRW